MSRRSGGFTTGGSGGGGGGGGGPVTNTQQTVSYLGHSFVPGDLVRRTAFPSLWVKAQASSVTDADVYGIVQSVTADTFTIITNGQINIPGAFSWGAVYWLSDVTPGLMTTTAPTAVGSVQKPVALGIDPDSALVITQMRGNEVSGETTQIAQTYWVTTTGSDVTGDGSILKPFATVQKAHDQATLDYSDSDYIQINIAPGTYTGDTTITRARTVFVGVGPARTQAVTLSGAFLVSPNTSVDKHTDTVTFQGIKFTSTDVATAPTFSVSSSVGLFSVLASECYFYANSNSKGAYPFYVDCLNIPTPRVVLPLVELDACIIQGGGMGPDSLSVSEAELNVKDSLIVQDADSGSHVLRVRDQSSVVLFNTSLQSASNAAVVRLAETPLATIKADLTYCTLVNSNSGASARGIQMDDTGLITAAKYCTFSISSLTALVVTTGGAIVGTFLHQALNTFVNGTNTGYNSTRVTKVDLPTTWTAVP